MLSSPKCCPTFSRYDGGGGGDHEDEDEDEDEDDDDDDAGAGLMEEKEQTATFSISVQSIIILSSSIIPSPFLHHSFLSFPPFSICSCYFLHWLSH